MKNDIATHSPLGKQANYIAHYSPALLFPILRQQSRELLGIKEPIPFHGMDIWTGYELSWLNPKGKPQVAIAEFRFPYDTPSLIESKSFKLYLNSFNQTEFSSVEEVQKSMEKDLCEATQGSVQVVLTPHSRFATQEFSHFTGICLDDLDIETNTYEMDPTLLRTNGYLTQEALYSNLLKTNCLVTGQPDWASIMIRYAGPQIDREGLLKYLISFRNHQGFHEQCVEKIFCDILERCRVNELTVYARYTRRGGLDINPFRSNFENPPLGNARLARQ